MKSGRILIPAGCACVLAVLTLFIPDMGSLLDHVLTGLFILIFGITFVVAAIAPDEKAKKNAKIQKILAIVIGVICIAIGCKNLTEVAIDTANGPKRMHLMDCEAIRSVSRRRYSRSFYIKGTNETGKEARYKITKAVYETYSAKDGFSIQFIGWEKSRVIKELLN